MRAKAERVVEYEGGRYALLFGGLIFLNRAGLNNASRGKGTQPMRNAVATAVLFGLCSVLPAAAANCPGNVTYHDTFTSAGPGWNLTTAPTVKVTMGGGKADFNFTQASLGQSLQYSINQYGDASLCATVNAPATAKAENEAAGITFWGTNPSTYYLFEVTVGGQFFVGINNNGTFQALFARQDNAAVAKGVGVNNTLQVTTKGTLATFYVNGAQVGTITGNPPAGGGTVGIYAETSTTSAQPMDLTDFQIAVP